MVMRIPPYPHAKIWEGPGSPYPYPDWNWTPHFDRFSLGIILFCLVALRFPHSTYLFPRDIDEQYKIYQLHQSETFDTLGEVPEYKAFEAIIQKCFRAQYPSTDEVFKDLKAACAAMPSDAPLLQDKILDEQNILSLLAAETWTASLSLCASQRKRIRRGRGIL
ncbi:hypothetical protein BT96DRAFT_1010293 [Gymnopus androsaceus JB14]|uniref:Protein kinase domain-containing protein n=1 Tax=Gymnopus androsaceus JB14 TaxID=1447944 RepID=A0A6A4GAW7_9AGAR|nr:hypothetical protein BT96DRAFT_1010293 [Gymnopus androsaceus JB14]